MKKENIDLSDLIGIPFVEFGRDKSTGLDCYGLAIEVCKRYGKNLTDIVLEKFDKGRVRKILPSLNLHEIDYIKECTILEFYGKKDNRLHVAVALDKNRFIHATESQGVRISSFSSSKEYLTLYKIYEVT